jgi:hypothetical protein
LVLNQGLRDLFSQASANSRSPNAIARVFNLSYDAIWNDQEKVWNGSLSFQQVYPLILKRAAAADLAPVEHKRPQEVAKDLTAAPLEIEKKKKLCLANCYEGRYYRQIAPRKADASPFLNGLGDSETIGAAKRTATKSAHTA